MITADLFARAIIASSVSLGEIKPLQMRSKLITANAYLPAAVAVATESNWSLSDVCRIVGVKPEAVAIARHAAKDRFAAAQEAAREAIRYHLKVQAEKAAQEASEPAIAIIEPEPAPKPPVARPAPRMPAIYDQPKLRPPKPKGRAMPKGVRFENLGNGVQVIRLKPITDSIARHARQQINRGADIEEVADLFEVSADSLRARIEGVQA